MQAFQTKIGPDETITLEYVDDEGELREFASVTHFGDRLRIRPKSGWKVSDSPDGSLLFLPEVPS
jgi:hypothetical protein